jgi:hypothetical protein
MAAAVFTTNVATRSHLEGDRWLVTGTITNDTGDSAAGGVLYPVAQLDATSIDRLLLFGTSIATTHVYWIKSTGKIDHFVEDSITGKEAVAGAAALDASTFAFVAVIRKAA